MTNTSNRIDEVQDFLSGAVTEVFGTMLTLDALPAPMEQIKGKAETQVAGSVGFIGEVSGMVFLRMAAPLATKLASLMLDTPEDQLDGVTMIDDAIGELSNMIVGSVKSRLCDGGSACVLTIPSVVRGQELSVTAADYSDRREMGFRCEGGEFAIVLLMKPVS